MNYIKSLDGVRGLAVSLVMLFHFYYVLECGWIGVQLFFVLSGYLITSILLGSKDNTLSFYLKRFYWRRSLRIFPLYYLYVLFFAATYLIMAYPPNFAEIAGYLFSYTYNFKPLVEGHFDNDVLFTPLWSLSVEEQFYLFWPFIVFFLNAKALRVVVVLLVIASPLLRLWVGDYLLHVRGLEAEAVGEIVYRITFLQLDAFAAGAAIPLFRLHDRVRKPLPLFMIAILLMLVAGWANYVALTQSGHQIGLSSLGYPIGGIAFAQHAWSYPLINLVSVFLILWLVSAKNNRVAIALFENRVIVALGKVSYGMYVYHWVVIAAYRKIVHPYIQHLGLSFIVYAALVYIISYLSFEFFEKWFVKLKDKKFKLISS